jgi:hypothetical protein
MYLYDGKVSHIYIYDGEVSRIDGESVTIILCLPVLIARRILLILDMLLHSNMTSFFRFVNKRAIYRLGIISLAHAPVHMKGKQLLIRHPSYIHCLIKSGIRLGVVRGKKTST